MSHLSKNKAHVQVAAVLVGLVLFFLLGVLVVRPPSSSKAATLLRQGLLQLEEDPAYDLVIEESAPGYNLTFQGTVEDKTVLAGYLPEFELELSYRAGELLVRKNSSEEWAEAATVQLQGLTGFLTSPLAVLRAQEEQFRDAFTGEDIQLGETQCKIVYLKLDPDTDLLADLFPEVKPANIQAVSMGAALTETDYRIKQLRLLIKFTNSGSLERVYYLN
ncbi:MAG: hypothetical protein AB1767_05935 [Bacillota bacterium]